MNTITRFWNKVIFTTDCWEWQGGKDKRGYGRFCMHYKLYNPHRVSYELYKGKIPNGLQIDHLCRNTSCVNPKHLEAVTQQENISRGISANKSKTHCPQGHEYSKENTYKHGGFRHCKTCNRLAVIKRRSK